MALQLPQSTEGQGPGYTKCMFAQLSALEIVFAHKVVLQIFWHGLGREQITRRAITKLSALVAKQMERATLCAPTEPSFE